MSCIRSVKFHECFINRMRECHSSDDIDVIAIDGKALPHSCDKSRRRRAGFRSLPRLSPALNTTPTHHNLNSSASRHAGNFSLYSRNAIIDSSASMRVA
ncbi:ISAs1 family transposase [Escherichia coli]|uniref:Aec6 n=1 Tax=Escherichia coli TaxID=562 RepID=Q6TKW2_ECOLX|nr:Aec6 [Escherichia coli]AUF89306.1 ISAs1 family transposase [Escherichia coli]